jgi:hypothetical protein
MFHGMQLDVPLLDIPLPTRNKDLSAQTSWPLKLDLPNLMQDTCSEEIREKPNFFVQIDSASSAAGSKKCLTFNSISILSMHPNSA